MNLKHITKRDLKVLIKRYGHMVIYLGKCRGNSCYGTTYKVRINDIKELDNLKEEAKKNGWKGNLEIFIKENFKEEGDING